MLEPATPGRLATQPEVSSTAAPVRTLEIFLTEIQHKAYRFARYELWDRDAALDAVQDSMLKLAENYRERPAHEWPALFYTILRNRITDARRWSVLERMRGLLRSSAANSEDDTDAPWERLLAPANDMPEAQHAANQQRRALDAALRQLPARQRQVFLLREWQGMTTAETAEVLGCSIGTVKQHHFRALQNLRAQLSEVWNDEKR